MANRWRSFLLGSLLCLGWLLGGCSSASTEAGDTEPPAPVKTATVQEEEDPSPSKDSASKKVEKPFRPASTHLKGKDPFLH